MTDYQRNLLGTISDSMHEMCTVSNECSKCPFKRGGKQGKSVCLLRVIENSCLRYGLDLDCFTNKP